MLSACEDATWDKLTTFPNDANRARPAPPIAAAQIDTPVTVQTMQAPDPAEPIMPPSAPVVHAPPHAMTAPAPVATLANYCGLMARNAGLVAAQDGFDEAGQQDVVDTTLRECLSIYGAK